MSGSRFLAPTTPGGLLAPGGAGLSAYEQLVLQQISNKVFFVIGEVPSGTKNSSNKVFTLANTANPATSIDVFYNGVRMQNTSDYNTSGGNTITFVNIAPAPTDVILVNYLRYP